MSKRASLTGLIFLWLLLAGCSLPNAAGDTTPAVISGAPIVQLASPLANATYLQEVTVNIQALVTNAGEGIDRVEISVDNIVVATVPSPNPANAPTFSVTQTWPAATAGTHTISVTAFRADGTASEPATVTVNVLEELPQVAANDSTATTAPAATTASSTGSTQVAVQPTNTTQSQPTSSSASASTVAPTSTNAPPTEAPTTAAARPVVKTRPGGLNVRRGASANFVPAIGVLAGDQTVEILAYNPNGVNPPGVWYKIPFAGGEGWIFSGLVDMEGDLNLVPVETGPPIPTLAPPTAPPAAPTAAATTSTGGGTTGVNLVLTVTEFRLVTPGANDGNNIFASEAAFARVVVTNNGTAATPTGFHVAVAIADKSNPNSAPIFADAGTGVLGAGQSITVDVPFTDTTQAGVERRAVILVDSRNEITETNEGDNNVVRDYTLGAR